MKKYVTLLLAILLFAGSLAIPAFAEESTSYRGVLTTSVSLVINSSDRATITASYTGSEGDIVSADVLIKFQKRTLGLFWTTQREWEHDAVGHFYTYVHEFSADNVGNYRAVVTWTIHYSDGSSEVIEKIATYSN